MDKEIFIEYFFYIFIILVQFFSNESIIENFFKLNIRFFLYDYLKIKEAYFLKETHFISHLNNSKFI